MKKNSDIVQMVVLIVFGIGIVLGVLFFSGKIPLPGDKSKQNGLSGAVTVWGVLPYGQMNSLMDTIEQQNKDLKITYVQKKPETIQSDLVNALSVGQGPDVFMMAPGQVAENIERLTIIPYTSYPDTVYKNTFIDPANDFLTNRGILALPLFVDPMVLFYNRDLFSNEFLIDPPATWNTFNDYVRKLTKKDDAGKITQAAAALGTTNNTSYTKDLIVLKSLQDGETFVTFDNSVGKWFATLGNTDAFYNAVIWFLNFSNKTSDLYTWNTSLINDRDMFTAGKLAMYFGYPNEYMDIQKKNPNLNFAMAMVPQSDVAGARKTNYGRVYSVGVSKITKNPSAALGVMNLLTSKDNINAMIFGTYYAPARRDMLNQKPRDNANVALVYNAAIISKSFFDPNTRETGRLITSTIDSINAGTKTMDGSIATLLAGFRDMAGKLKLPDVSLQ
jgi:ABC-type glycerol-3-phosphate transport system substrate-binding protein